MSARFISQLSFPLSRFLGALVFLALLTTAQADPGPRKIAVIASGYYDHDAPTLKGATDNEADETKKLLERHHYETTWARHESQRNASIELLNKLVEIDQEVNSGKLKKGDQVILLLLAHGDSKIPQRASHSVYFGSWDFLNLDFIRSYLKNLTDHGVKVALIDESCFSGNSLALAKSGACVISIQNQYNIGRSGAIPSHGKYGYVAEGFVPELKKVLESQPKSNLEEAFLKARENFIWNGLQPRRITDGYWKQLATASYSNDLPEISSSEHERLRPIWDRLFFTNIQGEPIEDYSPLVCTKIEDTSQDLRRALDLSAKAAFGDDLLSYDRFLELQLQRTRWITEVAKIDQARAQSKDFHLSETDLQRRDLLLDRIEKTENEYERLLGKVMMVERGLYTELYRGLQKQGLPSNPCREFKL